MVGTISFVTFFSLSTMGYYVQRIKSIEVHLIGRNQLLHRLHIVSFLAPLDCFWQLVPHGKCCNYSFIRCLYVVCLEWKDLVVPRHDTMFVQPLLFIKLCRRARWIEQPCFFKAVAGIYSRLRGTLVATVNWGIP